MKKKLKGLSRIIFGRTAFVILFLAIQIAILFSSFRWLSQYFVYIYGVFTLLSALVVIYIISNNESSSFKLSWVIPILVIPVFGALLYLFFRLQVGTKLINRRLQMLRTEIDPYLEQDPEVIKRLREESKRSGSLANYMNRYGRFPIYQNTNVTYFPLGEDMFAEMKRQLEEARHFIFMEYFIIERGKMWDEILEILKRKVKEGVEVRVMYDGMCCLVLLPYHYPEELEKYGIKCRMFAPIKPALSTRQNNRDHRKILVIDGHTAFTGGVNLADEYINEYEKYGHWKDTAIMMRGEAVVSFTMMFLQMWCITQRQQEDFSQFLVKKDYCYPSGLNMDGFVMPYGDSPLDGENVGEQVYIDILYQAKRYVHIMTPYLILDDEMIGALSYAAKRGIETIIIMPHIPDKKYAFFLAHSYYEELLEAGVQIYEYTPGFVHAKMFISDDEKAVVGTINLDFRSLYLHFECAAYIYKNPVVEDVEKDFMETLGKCQKITLETCRRYPFYQKIGGKALRLIAPLM